VLGTLRFGHQKEPFSLENAASHKYLVFMERSLIEKLAPSERDIGLLAFDTAFDERMRWSVGGFRSTESTGRAWTEPASYLITGRLTGLPCWQDEGRSLLHLGLSYSHQFSPETFGVSPTPESFLAQALVDSGSITSVEDVDRIGAELAWVRGPFSVQAEAIGNFVDRDGPTLRFWGAYVMVSWFVTGEHRGYERSDAAFGVVRPKRDFAPWRSLRDWGAVQLGARYSHVDLDDREVDGGVENDVALAASWFLRAWLRISGNYVFGHVRSQGDVHILQTRFQIEY
jgi:phosphate-selective porin OprO/OprP